MHWVVELDSDCVTTSPFWRQMGVASDSGFPGLRESRRTSGLGFAISKHGSMRHFAFDDRAPASDRMPVFIQQQTS